MRNGDLTQLLSEERHVVVRLLGGGQVRQGSEQRRPGGPGALGGVLLLLHVVLGPVEGEHAQLREEALQDGPLPGHRPQLVLPHRLRHRDSALGLHGFGCDSTHMGYNQVKPRDLKVLQLNVE